MLHELRDQLVAEGRAALAATPAVVRFTGDHDADELLNDLVGHPMPSFLPILVDRRIRAERARLP
jgi:hypothetical protein